MIKSDLISIIANRLTSLPEKDVALGVNEMVEYMAETLSRGERIEIRGFGSFSLHHRHPRNANNPKTGERVVTTEKYTPHFKPGKELKDLVNASRFECPAGSTSSHYLSSSEDD